MVRFFQTRRRERQLALLLLALDRLAADARPRPVRRMRFFLAR